MQKAQMERYRDLLKAKEAELLQDLRRREGIAIEKTPDVLEEGQLAALRELAICHMNRGSDLLRGVRAALRRIDEGTYGVCGECGETINPKRLDAVPWAEFCVRCQEAADRNENAMELESAEPIPSLRARAA